MAGESIFLVVGLKEKQVPFRFRQTNTYDAKELWVKMCIPQPTGRTNGWSSTVVASKNQMRPCRTETKLAERE